LILEAVAAWSETGRSQHECEGGIMEASQLPAIFSQHSRCSMAIGKPGDRHITGSVEATTTNAIDTNCDALGIRIHFTPSAIESITMARQNEYRSAKVTLLALKS